MKFTLREWREADAAGVARYANNEKIAANLRDSFPHPYTERDARAYIEGCLRGDSRRQYVRAIDVGGEAVGSIGAFTRDDVYRKSAEVGYWLAEPFWGRGITSGALELACGEAFVQLGVARLIAEPFAHNAASRRVLEKAGFILEGTLRKSVFKHGLLIDSCIYALLKI